MSRSGIIGNRGGFGARAGAIMLIALALACLGTLPWTLAAAAPGEPARYAAGDLAAILLPPSWAGADEAEAARRAALAGRGGATFHLFGTDRLGRDVFVRCLAGGGISIGIGLAAAAVSVGIGTLYGALAGFAGGRLDALMMRLVDVLYGLPSLLLVVLLAVAADALLDRAGEIPAPARSALEVLTLLAAIGGVSWLTMARVIRGQVLSLRARPFMEAARAVGAPFRVQFFRHLLPNLLGPIVVYATLTVPQAILQESFLSFLGIGVRPPLPSWGTLAAEGLGELNPVRIRWWLIVFPCALLGVTLISLNLVGEAWRERLEPRRAAGPGAGPGAGR